MVQGKQILKNIYDKQITEIGPLICSLQEKHDRVADLLPYSGDLVSPREAKRRLALQLYKDILLVLNRIENEISNLSRLGRLQSQHTRKRHGKISPKSKLYKILKDSFNYSEYLILDTTILFHWIYILEELLGKDRTFGARFIAFRHKFLVHYPEWQKSNGKIRQLMRSCLFSKDGPSLIYSPFFDKHGFRGFSRIEREVKEYIPEVQRKNNFNEKVWIIWENINQLPDHMRNPSSRNKDNFVNRLSRYGARSPSLKMVLEELHKVWNKKVVPLCKRK